MNNNFLTFLNLIDKNIDFLELLNNNFYYKYQY